MPLIVGYWSQQFKSWGWGGGGGGGGIHPRPPGISGSTYAMKLKLTPGMTLDKRCWLMTSSVMSLDLCLFCVTCVYTDQKPFLLTSAKTGWWRHKSVSLVKETPKGKFQLSNCAKFQIPVHKYFWSHIVLKISQLFIRTMRRLEQWEICYIRIRE